MPPLKIINDNAAYTIQVTIYLVLGQMQMIPVAIYDARRWNLEPLYSWERHSG